MEGQATLRRDGDIAPTNDCKIGPQMSWNACHEYEVEQGNNLVLAGTGMEPETRDTLESSGGLACVRKLREDLNGYVEISNGHACILSFEC